MLDAADPLHLIGNVIADRYRVVSQVGEGAMCTVYEVDDTSSGRRCALKVLRSDLVGNATVAARLVREGKAMGMFAHPHIVQLLDGGVLDDQRPYVVTELVTGISLRAMIDAGQLDPARALRMVRQVLEALDHAHRHGVIHRDIKPENIMLVDGGRPGCDEDLVKVLDFGIAKLVDDTRALLDEATLTLTGVDVLGTPTYAAPESLLGGAIDARTDLYSLGVVLFELLAGRPPFDAADPIVVARLHATTKAPTLAERAPERVFTPELEYVVAEALAKRPERRFASATDMIALVDAARASLEAPRGETLIGNANAIAMPPIASRAARWSRGRALAAFGRFPRRRQAAIVGIGLAAIGLLGVTLASLGSPHAVAAPLEAHADAKPAVPEDATALVARGDRDLSRGLSLDAAAAYERALARAPQLAGDAQIRANLVTVATGADSAAAIVALELLATRVQPAARDEIVAQASQGKLADVRQRALAIAERDGFVDAVDRLGSYVLDLKDAKSCDIRRAAIDKLRALSDRRAIGALRRARDSFPCVRDAAIDALAYLEANP